MVDLLATTSDAIQGRPSTVTAFTSAYVRALRDLHSLLDAGDPQPSASPGASPAASLGPDELFQVAADAGIEVTDALRADWRQSLAVLSPDGGFGPLADDGGLGTLRRSLTSDTVVLEGPDGFLWTDGLHAAQRWLGLPENPSPTPVPSPSASLLPSPSVTP